MYRLPPKHILSKSTFMYGTQCARRLWLHKNLSKERNAQTVHQAAVFQQGTDIGELARQLFPGGIDASPENHFSYQASVSHTSRYIRAGHQIIYEAAFQYEGILCAIDILVKINGKWHAFEVKSTTSVKESHITDAALQYFVITGTGIDLEDISIIHLNGKYIREDSLNAGQFFSQASVLEPAQNLQHAVAEKSRELMQVLSNNTPPDVKTGNHCTTPYPCDFTQFCNLGLPAAPIAVSNLQCELAGLRKLKANSAYPHCFLHVDAWASSVPLLKGHWPYRQVCFHFAAQKVYDENETSDGFYLLADGFEEQRKFIEILLSVLDDAESIFVHQASFSGFRLKQYGKDFPDLAPSIDNLLQKMQELPEPFHKDFHFAPDAGFFPVHTRETVNALTRPVITDHHSASATFFNHICGQSTEPPEAVFARLRHYAMQSSEEMMKWFELV